MLLSEALCESTERLIKFILRPFLADGESLRDASSESDDETSCECKHSMDIMYDRQMSVTIASFIGDIMKKEAEKLEQERNRGAESGQGSEAEGSSRGREEASRAESGDLRSEQSGRGLWGKSRKKGPGVRFSDDSFRDRHGRNM